MATGRLRVCYQNLGHGVNCYEKFKDIENILNTRHPHVIFIGEKQIDEDSRTRLNFFNYEVETLDQSENDRIWCAVSKSVEYKRRKDLESKDAQCIWLQFGRGRGTYLIGGVYREFCKLDNQPRKITRSLRAQRERWQTFLRSVNKVFTKYSETHLLGDMNLNATKWRQNGHRGAWERQPMVDDLYDLVLDPNDVVQTIPPDTVTWSRVVKDKVQKSCIDLHLTSKPSNCDIMITNDTSSDHRTLILTRRKPDQVAPPVVTKRAWSKVDYEALKREVEEKWIPTLNRIARLRDVNDLEGAFTAFNNNLLDPKTPRITYQIPRGYCPWMTKELRELQKERNKALRESFRLKTDKALKDFHVLRNKASHLNEKLKALYWKSAFRDEELLRPADCQRMWKMQKNYHGWPSPGPPDAVLINGVKITDPQMVAEEVNNCLIGKIQTIKETTPVTQTDPLSFTKKYLEGKPMIPRTNLVYGINCKNVKKAIKSLKNSDAEGHDGISTRYLKIMRKPLAYVITRLVNLSFITGEFPANWKIARIQPLFKGGDRFDPKCYRPVAILPAASKIPERIVMQRLQSHMESKRLYIDTQHGYRNHRSCSTAVLQLQEEILKDAEKNVDTALIFLDMSCAFDTIDHETLLSKLKLYGMDDKTLKWFRSYLSDRFQYTEINGRKSSLQRIKFGVFQGSISGPFQFLIIINDIIVVVNELGCEVYVYADDSTVRYRLTGNLIEDQRKLDLIMKCLVDYMNSTKLKFNMKKTQFLIVSKKNHNHYKNLKLNYEGNTIEQVREARLLGVYFTWNCSQDYFIRDMPNNLVTWLERRYKMLYKIRNQCEPKVFKCIAHGLVMSKIEFCIQFWAQTTELNKDRIRVIMNKTCRLANGVTLLDKIRNKELYRRQSWLNLDALQKFHDIGLLRTIMRTQTPLNMYNAVIGNVENPYRIRTRQRTTGQIQYTRNNTSVYTSRHDSFQCRAIRAYNDLPRDLIGKYYDPRLVRDPDKAERNDLRRHLIEHQFN